MGFGKTLQAISRVAPLAYLVSGCMSMQSQPVQDAVQAGAKPYVEAYIEYPGPASRWLGPPTWTLHVNTRDLHHPSLSVTPEFEGGADSVAEPAARLAQAPAALPVPGGARAEHAEAPAGALAELQHAAHPDSSASLKKPAVENAATAPNPHPEALAADRHMASAGGALNGRGLRDELGSLATSVQNAGETPYQGCLNPIRIRLIREDGALLERQGCRGSQGWSHTLSQSVSGFLAQRYGK